MILKREVNLLFQADDDQKPTLVPIPSGKSRNRSLPIDDGKNEKNPFVIPPDADMFKMQDDEVKRQAQFRREQRNLKGTAV